MEVSHNQDKIGRLVQFHKSCSILLIYSERIKPSRACQVLEVQGGMMRIGKKQGLLFLKLFPDA